FKHFLSFCFQVHEWCNAALRTRPIPPPSTFSGWKPSRRPARLRPILKDNQPMAQPRIVVTRKLPDAVEERLRQHFTVALNPDDTPFTRARLMRAMQEADGILASITDPID